MSGNSYTNWIDKYNIFDQNLQNIASFCEKYYNVEDYTLELERKFIP